MKNYTRRLSSVLALLLMLNTTSFAWNARGHMMVAGIAWGKLTEAKRDRVVELLALNPDFENWLDLIPDGTSDANERKMIFMIAATWPDRIKSDPHYHIDGTNNGNTPPSGPGATQNTGYDDFARHKYWHFKDIPFSTDGTALPGIVTPNAETQLNTFMSVLASSTASDELKSYDLSWFLHLIGDVHQPLHCTARITATDTDGDDGGNGVKIKNVGSLHSYWDGVLGRGTSLSTLTNAIAGLPASSRPSNTAANNLTVADWINESFEAAKNTVYKPPIGATNGPFTLNQSYKTKARTLAEKRAQLAGARLAKIINDQLQ